METKMLTKQQGLIKGLYKPLINYEHIISTAHSSFNNNTRHEILLK